MADLKRGKKATSKKNVTSVNNTKDYSQDPLFIRKRERAKEIIDKYGIPEKFLKLSGK